MMEKTVLLGDLIESACAETAESEMDSWSLSMLGIGSRDGPAEGEGIGEGGRAIVNGEGDEIGEGDGEGLESG